MGIIEFFIICVVIGVVVFLIHKFLPIPQVFKTIILWAGVIVCVLLLLHALGVFGHDIKIPKIK